MGIKSLTKLIADEVPGAIREQVLKNFTGQTIAIDASMALYQFLVAIRSHGDGPAALLTNEAGEVTSHLQGMLGRTIRLMEKGIKPVYVFDGKAPDLKSGEIEKRRAIKAKAAAELKEAQESGTAEDVDRYSKRTVSVTREHNDDVKRLLRLMGVPVIEAPGEAEAQCAVLAAAGKVYATASEDMDTLTFGSPYLLRRLTLSEQRKLPVLQFDLSKVLEGLGLTHPQFVDMCMLCGCDYLTSIKGIGPKKSLAAIRKYGSLEAILESLDTKRYPIPDNFPYQKARQLFLNPDVADPASVQIKFTAPDEQGLKDYLVGEKGFNEERLVKQIARLKKARRNGSQRRLDSFFTRKPSTAASSAGKKKGAAGAKRKGAAKGKVGGARKRAKK